MDKKEVVKFLLTKEFLRQLLYAIGGIIVLVFFIMLVLRFRTHHNQAIAVPDLSGMTLNEAEEALDDSRLRIEVLDSVYNPTRERGTVVAQKPHAGFKVKSRRIVYITVNANNPEKVKMPDITGRSLREIKPMLEAMGLLVGRISYTPDISTNIVLQQRYKKHTIAPGTSIEKGSKIDVVLGMGVSGESTSTPELAGLTLTEAQGRLVEAYLNVGAVKYDSTVNNRVDSVRARVWKQNPPFSENFAIHLGATIDLWLTLDPNKLKNSPSNSSPETPIDDDEEDY
jgi:eukaryotic-like serine/threonine-protein kinase